jgi:DNA replication protein DnaC
VPRLFEELGLARVDGTYARVLAKLAKADVLILDDLGVGTLKEPQRHDLLEVLEDRYDKLSTVVDMNVLTLFGRARRVSELLPFQCRQRPRDCYSATATIMEP